MKKISLAYWGLAIAATLATANTSAAITGQVDVKLNVSSGCKVNNSTENGNINKFGTLDFGKTSSTWSNILTAEVASAGNGSDITVTCDAGVPGFKVSVDGGEKGSRKDALQDHIERHQALLSGLAWARASAGLRRRLRKTRRQNHPKFFQKKKQILPNRITITLTCVKLSHFCNRNTALLNN